MMTPGERPPTAEPVAELFVRHGGEFFPYTPPAPPALGSPWDTNVPQIFNSCADCGAVEAHALTCTRALGSPTADEGEWRNDPRVQEKRNALSVCYGPVGMSPAKQAAMDQFRDRLDALCEAVAACSLSGSAGGAAPVPGQVIGTVEIDLDARRTRFVPGGSPGTTAGGGRMKCDYCGNVGVKNCTCGPVIESSSEREVSEDESALSAAVEVLGRLNATHAAQAVRLKLRLMVSERETAAALRGAPDQQEGK